MQIANGKLGLIASFLLSYIIGNVSIIENILSLLIIVFFPANIRSTITYIIIGSEYKKYTDTKKSKQSTISFCAYMI